MFKPKLGHGNPSTLGLAPQTGARNLAGMKWERGRMKATWHVCRGLTYSEYVRVETVRDQLCFVEYTGMTKNESSFSTQGRMFPVLLFSYITGPHAPKESLMLSQPSHSLAISGQGHSKRCAMIWFWPPPPGQQINPWSAEQAPRFHQNPQRRTPKMI